MHVKLYGESLVMDAPKLYSLEWRDFTEAAPSALFSCSLSRSSLFTLSSIWDGPPLVGNYIKTLAELISSPNSISSLASLLFSSPSCKMILILLHTLWQRGCKISSSSLQLMMSGCNRNFTIQVTRELYHWQIYKFLRLLLWRYRAVKLLDAVCVIWDAMFYLYGLCDDFIVVAHRLTLLYCEHTCAVMSYFNCFHYCN